MSTDNKIVAVKTRFAVRMVERNINFVICGDPDAMRIYTTLEGIDLRYPLQVRREAVHKLVLELNQHITVGSFQLEERPLALPNIEHNLNSSHQDSFSIPKQVLNFKVSLLH